jgi:hypothetical protein
MAHAISRCSPFAWRPLRVRAARYARGAEPGARSQKAIPSVKAVAAQYHLTGQIEIAGPIHSVGLCLRAASAPHQTSQGDALGQAEADAGRVTGAVCPRGNNFFVPPVEQQF